MILIFRFPQSLLRKTLRGRVVTKGMMAVFLAVSFLLQSCSYEQIVEPEIAVCDSSLVYFAKEVLPILNSNCALGGCHDLSTQSGDVILTDYTNVMNTAGIKPDNAEESVLYKRITSSNPDERMPPPPRDTLAEAQKDIIRKWIDQGAKNLVCK